MQCDSMCHIACIYLYNHMDRYRVCWLMLSKVRCPVTKPPPLFSVLPQAVSTVVICSTYWFFMLSTQLYFRMWLFWDVAPCSLVEFYQCFKGVCCLHQTSTRLHGTTSQKTIIFILASMRTWNLINCIFIYVTYPCHYVLNFIKFSYKISAFRSCLKSWFQILSLLNTL
jgi:hypothetical protein